MLRIHKVKTVQPYFDAQLAGLKTFELRLNDRDYQVGDILYSCEYDAETETFTGRTCFVEVTYMLEGTPWLTPGYVAMSVVHASDWKQRVAIRQLDENHDLVYLGV